jgi:hypothetical protein
MGDKGHLMNAKKGTHGGPGRGQGRKTPDSPSGELKVYSVRLDPTTVEALKEIGGGNVSAGIRMAIKRLYKHTTE